MATATTPGTTPVDTVENTVNGYAKSLKACVLTCRKRNGKDVERQGFVHSVKESRGGSKTLLFLDMLRKGPRSFKLDNVISIVDY